jgi:hypothetical protein
MNEKCYLISFEISNSQQEAAMMTALRAYEKWAKITTRTWAIVTTENAETIRNRLLSLVDTNDKIIVVKSGYEAAWWNSYCANEWLKSNL